MSMHTPHIRDQRTCAVGFQSIGDVLLGWKNHLQPLGHSMIVGWLTQAA
jgi:hypothetical protein